MAKKSKREAVVLAKSTKFLSYHAKPTKPRPNRQRWQRPLQLSLPNPPLSRPGALLALGQRRLQRRPPSPGKTKIEYLIKSCNLYHW